MERAQAPDIFPKGGWQVAPVSVSIQSPLLARGATIHYTTDGEDPHQGPSNRVYDGSPFSIDTAGEPVVTIKAVVVPHWQEGLAESDVASVSFKVLHPPRTPPDLEPVTVEPAPVLPTHLVAFHEDLDVQVHARFCANFSCLCYPLSDA